MHILDKFKAYIKQQNLFQPKDKLLLAVSGGVDSVVLCELCKQAGYDFVIAHCNFQLRGEESERDENFVKDLGKKYEVEVFVKKFDTQKYADENKLSIQVAARELRYKWFDELLTKMKSSLSLEGSKAPLRGVGGLLTAHHANDNMETLLMNFFKGTGITGLHGILPKQGNIIRPLLFAKKEDLLGFATGNKLAFVEDSSNTSHKYTRNYFRNELIPALQKIFPQVEDNLINNIDRFREIELLYRQSIEMQKKKLLEQKGNEVHIPVLKLMKVKPLQTIMFEIIKDYGFTAHQSEEVISLLKSESGKYIQSASHRVLKNRNWIIISPIETKKAENILIEREGAIEFAEGILEVKKIFPSDQAIPVRTGTGVRAGNIQYPIINSQPTAQLDADEIQFPLLLRKWKKGDYFYPLGMQKKKKLSRFFIDQKLSLNEKEKTWIIEMDKKIIWVVGLRIDDRFKIKPTTKQILQITVSFTK